MTKTKRPKLDEDYEEPVQLLGVGSYARTTVEKRNAKVKPVKIVGFVRPKQQRRRK
jgi:hypothetical protein